MKINKHSWAIVAMVAIITGTVGCSNSTGRADSVQIPVSPADFETTVDGVPVKLYTLSNDELTVTITNYGARIVSLQVPDRQGKPVDVVLGYRDLSHYRQEGEAYFGAIVGRYGNRIAGGRFSLDGQVYQLELNDGPNTLHGGKNGFSGKVWEVQQATADSLVMRYIAYDGEAGFPGRLEATVTYRLTTDNGLAIQYRATTDKPTVVNLTNHAYFNLNGAGDPTILDHTLMIHADDYTPVNETLIPTGEIAGVSGTPFDFREPKAIGARIDAANEQLKYGQGYDHNFVLRKSPGLQPVATVTGPKTGIVMEVLTEEPGMQFYSGNFMDEVQGGKGDHIYHHRSAFCLETQHFPDSPNQPQFPSTVLRPGEVYQTETVYRFR